MTPRTFVVGDIHGCSTALEAVLCASGFAGNDILITLGDMIDRGPNTRGVLDFLMRLLGERRLIPIRGNHEVMMQHALDSGRDSQWFASGGLQTLESFGLASNKAWRSCLPKDYRSFIVHDCVDYWEDERFIFTHAGLEAGLGLADQPHSTLFWSEYNLAPAPHFSGKTSIHGHTVVSGYQPMAWPHAWFLDTGAYLPDGWLSCVDIDTGKIWQANQQGKIRQAQWAFV